MMPSLDQEAHSRNSSVLCSRFLTKYRAFFAIVSLALLLAAMSGLPKIGFNANYHAFFKKDNPELQALNDFQAIYSKDDNITIVIHHPDKSVFSNQVLGSIKNLTEALWSTRFVTRVDSVTNYQHTEVKADDLFVNDLVGDLPLIETVLLEKQKIALNAPLLRGLLVSENAQVTQVNATLLLPTAEENQNAAREIFDAVQQLIEKEQKNNPEIEYRINGSLALNVAFAKTTEDELKVMMPMMFGVIILFLGILFRSFWGVILPLTIVFISVVFTLGLSGHLGIFLTPVSAAFPQILISVSVAYSIHIMVSYVRFRQKGLASRKSIEMTLEKNLSPIVLTALTTAVGFFSMTLNEVPPVQHLGILVGSGVLFTALISITLLPYLLQKCSWQPKAAAKSSEDSGVHWSEYLGQVVLRRSHFFFYSMLGIAIISSLFILRLELDDNPVNYFKEGTWYRDSADFIDANLTGVSSTDYALNSEKENGITDPDFLKEVESFSNYLRSIPEVVHVRSIVPVIKEINRNLHDGDPSYDRLPETQELTAQYLLLYSLSLPFGLDLTDRINVNYSSTRVSVRMKKVSQLRHLEILEQVKTWSAENLPDREIEGVGIWVMFSHLSHRVIRGMLKSLAFALFLITALNMVTFRSVRLGLISLIPNALPLILTFGIWGMLGDHIDFSVSIVASVALGIIVDDTIHLMMRYQKEIASGVTNQEAILVSMRDAGDAVLFTSIILIAGFGLFIFSDFRVNSSQGVMISLTIALALLYDLLFLPAVLIQFNRHKDPLLHRKRKLRQKMPIYLNPEPNEMRRSDR